MEKQPMTDEQFYKKYEEFEKQADGNFMSKKVQANQHTSGPLEDVVDGKEPIDE